MDVFVYGPLLSPTLMAAITGAPEREAVPAVLPDHKVAAVADGGQAVLVPLQGVPAPGAIWQGLSETAIARLRVYLQATGHDLHPVSVRVAGQPRVVQAGLPVGPPQTGCASWSLALWQADHLRPALLAVQELLSLDPVPTPDHLRRMWPMIEARAWSRHRARAAPATIRRQAGKTDMVMHPNQPPKGWFYRFQGFDVDHIRFDGSRSPVLKREAFIGFDAVIVLPYDPARDRVLLLEQPRIGPLVRHDPNPWMLEAVAGIVDAREDPQHAALRETAEEAGLVPHRLIPAGEYYPSPGPSTDYFYTYIALCDLADTAAYAGGLVEEGEDLRLHPMSFDAALALAESGEITTGPLLTLLYWLARHRDRLRAMG